MPADVKAGGAYVEISGKSEKVDKLFKSVQTKMRNFGASMAKMSAKLAIASAAILAPLAKSLKTFANLGDQIAKVSRRIGISTEALSGLNFAAELTGTDLGGLEKAIRGMQRSIYDAEDGLTTATDALDFLGVSLESLRGLAPEEQFSILAEAVAGVSDSSMRAGVAMKLFGARAGTALLPLFAVGPKGFKAMREEAEALGITFSAGLSVKAEELTDNMLRVKMAFKGLQIGIATALLPQIETLMARIIGITINLRKFVETHPSIVAAIANIGMALAALAVAFAAVATTFIVLSNPIWIALGGISLAILGILEALGIVDVGIGTALSAIGGKLEKFAFDAFLLLSGLGMSLALTLSEAFQSIVQLTFSMVNKVSDLLLKLYDMIPLIGSAYADSMRKIRDSIEGVVTKPIEVNIKRLEDINLEIQRQRLDVKFEQAGEAGLFPKLKNFIDEFKNIFSAEYKFPKFPEPSAAGAGAGGIPGPPMAISGGISGTYGARAAEMRGGYMTVEQKQLNVLEGMSDSLNGIEKNTENMGATYAAD